MKSFRALQGLGLAFVMLCSVGGLGTAVAAPLPSSVRWVVAASPTTADLNAVDMVSETDGWIAGANGTLLRYNGETWTPYALPVTLTLTSLSIASASDGWAVGYDPTGTRILRWNGTVWSDVPVDPLLLHRNLTQVSTSSSGSTWITGGMTFSNSGSSCGPTNPSCPYDGANSWPYLWNGSAFSETNGSGYYLSYIEAVSSTLAFSAGFRGDVNPFPYPGALLRWNGSSWQAESLPSDTGGLTDIFIRTPTDGWVVGRSDIFHWNGTDWSLTTKFSTPTLVAVEATAQDEAWAVGVGGSIQHWDGSTWQVMSSSVSVRLASLSLVGTNQGWAVGSGGTILRLVDLPNRLFLPTLTRP